MIDDPLFNAVMNSSIKCVELILRIILDNHSLKVEKVITQYTVPNMLFHGVRFDVLATANGKVYDIEVQRDDSGAIPRRARYNSSMLDANILRAGKNYNELPESYVIFITENDVLRKEKPIYHIARKIDETDEYFDDGSHIIYVNGENRADTELGLLMQDFFCADSAAVNYDILAERIRYFKETKEGLSFMSPIVKEIYDKGIEQGIEQGIERGIEQGREEMRIETVIDLLRENQPIEFVAKISKLSVDKVKEIGKMNALI